MSFMDKLVSGKELIGVKKYRSQPFIFEKFEYELQSKRESEGWIVDKELKSMVRMKHAKPLDEQFEDEVWCLFASLGFSYMNRDRHLEIPYGTEGLNTTKQIDVFAVDEETKLYNQGTMTFYAHENVENLGVYIFSCSFTRALICGKIIINDVVSVQPQKEIEMKTTDINKVRYTNRWRIVYGICNN